MKPSVSDFRVSTLLSLAALAGSLVTGEARSQELSTLMYFNGSEPVGGLTLGIDGALYGIGSETTFVSGGATGGLLYRLTTDASAVNTIYQYGRLGDYQGEGPRGTLARDGAGILYGVTQSTTIPPVPTTCIRCGSGTVFKINGDGSNYTQLHVFTDSTGTAAPFTNSDGIQPIASLLLAGDGFLYGTTTQGGTNGFGTIFKIATDGTGFTVIHNFAASTTNNVDLRPINADGTLSFTRLMLANDGNLYGTTTYGGINGTGVIYTLHRDGSAFSVLFNFDVSVAIDATTGLQINTTGSYPLAGVVQASNGLLYGTAQQQGPNGFGTVYRIGTDGGNFTVLKSFKATDGASPSGELIVANDGTIVGTTAGGGQQSDAAMTAGAGTIYSMTLDGATFSNIYVFGFDGGGPSAGVIQTSDGSYYGSTSKLGIYGQGTVFKFGAVKNTATPQGTPEDRRGGAIEWWMLLMLALLFATRIAMRRLEVSQKRNRLVLLWLTPNP